MIRVPVECYSRIVGYLRPTSNWAKHKQLEFKERKVYKLYNNEPVQGTLNECGKVVGGDQTG